MKPYDTILFDLDGTLLNTIRDIRESLNHAFEMNGLVPEFSDEDAISFIGSGAEMLIRRAIMKIHESENRLPELYQAYASIYSVHRNDHAVPFEGVEETLRWLKGRGYRLGVISNKPDEDTKGCVSRFFPGIFDFVVGARAGVRTKPDPDVFTIMAQTFCLKVETTLYVGDMEVDIFFGKNVGMDVAICQEGFGKISDARGQKYTLERFGDLMRILEE